VTSKTATTLRTEHTLFPRLLAFVLLALVAYTTTVEAAHNHGNFSLDRPGNTASAISNYGDADSTLKESQAYGDCLICQLQQYISTSLFSTPPQIVAPLAEATETPAVEISYFSQSNTPPRGRAPPFFSLV
jgi:hypothetical protein